MQDIVHRAPKTSWVIEFDMFERRFFLLFWMFLLSPWAALADPGVHSDKITLGMANALTGPAAALGMELREGALACFGRINAAGGIHGRRIDIVSLDDGYEPLRAEAMTRKLIDEYQVFALFGYVGTPTSAAAVRVAKRGRVPYLAPFTGAEFLRNPVSPLVFNVRTSYYDEAESLVKHATGERRSRRIAVAAQDDSFGDAVRTGVNRAMFRRDMKIVGEGRFRRNTTEVADAVKQITAASPEVIIMVGGYTSLAAFVREYRKTGQNPLFMTVSFVGTAGFIREAREAGEGVVISQVVPSPFDASHALVSRYQKAMLAEKRESFGYGSLEGCLDAIVFAEALKRAGPDPDRIKLQEAFESMDDVVLEGVRLSYGRRDHQGMNEVFLTRIQGGKPVPVDKTKSR
jgi:ABC-type branched-subunit amino acid transport system substrate-binding protein